MNNKIGSSRVHLLKEKIKVIIVLLMIISSYSFNSAFAESIASNEIKVMTFNIRYGTADDGENSWKFRKDKVVEELKKLNPDILGLQEALTFQIEEILNALPAYSYAGVGRDDGKKAGEYSCILFNKNRFTIDTTETFWFSDTPNIPGSKHWGNNITRICTWIKLTDKITGKSFYHYNLHIDHESQPSREKSMEFLLKKMELQKEKLPIILSGDFNCGDENPAIKIILTNGFTDTYYALHGKSSDDGTFNNFKGETNGEKIDFIFVSKDFQIEESAIIRDSFNEKYLSDHFPVTAKLLLR